MLKDKVSKLMFATLDESCDTMYQKTFFEITNFPYFLELDTLIWI